MIVEIFDGNCFEESRRQQVENDCLSLLKLENKKEEEIKKVAKPCIWKQMK